MIRDYAIIRESARRIAEAANGTTQALIDARVEQEPAFTDRMLGRIEHAMEGFETKGVHWTAKTLTDRGPKAQEKQFGADFVGVLTIRIPEYSVSKGFLAQAKLIEPNELSVVSAGRCNPHDLYSRSVSRFYEEHFQSFIGDRDIHAPSIAALEQTRERTRARRLLYLGAQTG